MRLIGRSSEEFLDRVKRREVSRAEGGMRTKCLLMVFGVGLICLVTSVSRADVVYDETNGDPDLSDNYLAPTPIQLGYGSNTITLHINRSDPPESEIDLDLFRVDIPVGGFLRAVNLTYSLTESAISFMGFQSGDVWSFDMSETGDASVCLTECVGFGHFSPSDVGTNLFDTMITQMQQIYGRPEGFDYPLPDSQYVFWAQEFDEGDFEYSFDFNVTVPGDYNFDGTVNAADYTVWRNTLGNFTDVGDGADGNRSGMIDQQDYEIWKTTYGMITYIPDGASVDAGSNVPEPTTILLSIVSSILMAGMARRRR